MVLTTISLRPETKKTLDEYRRKINFERNIDLNTDETVAELLAVATRVESQKRE